MTTCQVIRCPRPASHAVRLTPEDAVLMEGVVCDEHKAQIDAGAPYRWEHDPTAGITGGYLVMGADLDVSSFTVSRFKGTEEHALVHAYGSGPGTTLVFERILPDGSTAPLRLLVSEDVLDQLKETFDLWLRPGPRVDDAEPDNGDAPRAR